jgi:fructose-bisphosphate aldolase class 1
VTATGLGDCISGAILYDETIRCTELASARLNELNL